jgi:hypothetical protein
MITFELKGAPVDQAESSPRGDRAWAIVRDEPAETLAVIRHERTAYTLAADLGPGHHVDVVAVLSGAAVQVAHTWQCRATVTGDQVELDEPAQLAGASRLILPGDDPAPSARAVVDAEASALEAAVQGVQVHYVIGQGPSAEQARNVARVRAEALAAGETGIAE